jgi:choline transport protein
LGWVTGCPSAAQLTSTLIQGLVLLKNNDANFTSLYQTTLLVMLFLLISVGFNIFFARSLPTAEGIFLIVHVFGYFAYLIVLWIMSDHAPAKQVFATFVDEGGWGNQGLSCLVGITTPLWCFLGPDAGAHMSEELKDASRVLPSAMVWATIFNGILGLSMLITFCFCIGDVDAVLNGPTGIPVIQVLYNCTGSYAGTVVMTVVLILLSLVGTITCIAASSRQMWAFARDKGFPFSSYIEHVSPLGFLSLSFSLLQASPKINSLQPFQVRPGWDIPVNAIIVVLGVSLAITALNFGSAVALNAIISLSNAALLISYITSIGLLRLKRLRNQPLLPRRWSLGKWGGPVNDVALAFLIVSFVMSFFPTSPNPDAADMNWAIVIFVVVVVAAMVNYYVNAHKHYIPPVCLVKND